MSKQVSGVFRSTNPGGVWNLSDSCPSTGGQVLVTAWSSGATLVDGITNRPPSNKRWQVEAWSISAIGSMLLSGPLGAMNYGRAGKLIGGPIRNPSETRTPPSIGLPYLSSVQLPTDTSNLQTLWDGSQDPPWRVTTAANTDLPNGTPFTISANLASPIELGPSDAVGMCLILTSSLGQGFGLVVTHAAYTLSYTESGDTHSSTGFP